MFWRLRQLGPLFFAAVCLSMPSVPVYAWDLDKTKKQLLEEREAQFAISQKLLKERKIAEAVAAGARLAAIDRELLARTERSASSDGKGLEASRERLAATLEWTADLHERQGGYATAAKLRKELLSLREKMLGSQHWKVTDARLSLALLERVVAMTAEEREQWADAIREMGRVYSLLRQGRYRDAVPSAQKAAEAYKTLAGKKHPSYATCLENLALVYHETNDYARAKSCYQQALDIRQEVLGELHPHYGIGLNNLAELCREMGDYVQAESMYRRALEIQRELPGKRRTSYATSLNNLGALYHTMGDYARAEPLLQQALEIKKDVLGGKHPGYVASLNTLASLYSSMGDYSRAEPLLKRALEILKELTATKHPYYATTLNNLASVYGSMGHYAQAEPLLQQALAIAQELQGDKHTTYATGLNNLARMYQHMGRYAQAEPLLRQASMIVKSVLGDRHRYHATLLSNLACCRQSTGDYGEAEALLQQALDIRKEVLGDKHPEYAASLNNLAVLYVSAGEDARSEPLSLQAFQIAFALLDLSATVQSERQQLVMSRSLSGNLDLYLSSTSRLEPPAEAIYKHVLAWKGAVLARQRWLRLSRNSRDPQTIRCLTELKNTASRVASLAFSSPDPGKRDVWHRQIEELTVQRERLEKELAQRSVEFRKEQARAKVTPTELQQTLPTDTAIVDLLEYTHFSPAPDRDGTVNGERRLVAFVVLPDRAIVRVELGPVAPIARAVDQWRADLGLNSIQGKSESSKELRRLVWQPLTEHLTDSKTVLVSPDGVLNRAPLAALPGSKPKSFLIEETALAVVPVPHLLPELLAPKEDKPSDDTPPSMFLVGDVDFDASPTAPAETAVAAVGRWRGAKAGALHWNRLPGTRAEILAIGESYRKAISGMEPYILREDLATESAVSANTPDYDYLHFATHGFFAPPDVRSALARDTTEHLTMRSFDQQHAVGFHPGLLSGIALAGANKPADGGDDGVLTASEVATLDLRKANLVALSACETGLGEVAGGEGVLGLQRAFQVAGANTVVASLWQVDDAATQALMVEFYKNLWEKKLGKLEALRQAQLAMLERYRPREGLLRGAIRLDEPGEAAKSSDRLPPKYWAGFVLSGDWR